ncbi:MAG: GlsB/YeaQ/YmgE family stress response membrane protein [Prevotella sp.]|nr:GlsB/YeaQ/YmgE family stress response membrane protein [Prevotella sp.]
MIESIIIGILAGFLAAKLTGGEGKGCWIDLLLGLVGGVVGRWLLSLLGISWEPSWLSNIGTATIGAVVVL